MVFSWVPPPVTIILLLMTLVIFGFTAIHHGRALRGQVPARRRIPALDMIKTALGRCAETGRALHISSGAGTLNNRATAAETVVGLLAADRVAREAALKGAPIVTSSGDVLAYLALRGVVHQAYRGAGRATDYNSADVRLVSHQDALAYATGVTMLNSQQRFEAAQLLGSFGHEFLLAGEDSAQRDIPQVAGGTSMEALPVMMLTTPTTLIGEEVFAAEAYLGDDVSQARLMTQDSLRIVVIVLLLLGVVYVHAQPVLDGLLPFSLPPLPMTGM